MLGKYFVCFGFVFRGLLRVGRTGVRSFCGFFVGIFMYRDGLEDGDFEGIFCVRVSRYSFSRFGFRYLVG